MKGIVDNDMNRLALLDTLDILSVKVKVALHKQGSLAQQVKGKVKLELEMDTLDKFVQILQKLMSAKWAKFEAMMNLQSNSLLKYPSWPL
jgi:hypothetical protein